ncbi:sugar phosphate isomerase/epimerase [Algoriphagus sp. A40]|uniref:sugar phosphate isomerase/epimerase family protein n=1 Tax=Algoriphagus sp. A40 TaxID=1945863 RepID=UPI0009851BA8|nr:TIM barrel protein [Algoriphagus sp. A40]OOG75340.1 xylose isomerase [Algoriphagus sp. A40]
MNLSRRNFIDKLSLASAGIGISTLFPTELIAAIGPDKKKFTAKLSLGQFSFASELYAGKMTMFDFPKRATEELGIDALEFVSGFFNNKHTDSAYLKELKNICDGTGATSNLIMVDGENIAALDPAVRKKAVESHFPWVDAAKYLGCTSIRVNLGDTATALRGDAEEGSPEEAAEAALEGYSSLLEYGEKAGLNIIVENHFGYSTNPDWLVGILSQVKSSKKGLLPDFGNFCAQRSKPVGSDLKSLIATTCLKEYDKYDGVSKMMPYAKGISAKSHKFDANGNDLETDYRRMFEIIKSSGWTGGYIGIEYEGGIMRDMGGDTSYLSNSEGILAMKKLILKTLEDLA